jgi:hypothetical protein
MENVIHHKGTEARRHKGKLLFVPLCLCVLVTLAFPAEEQLKMTVAAADLQPATIERVRDGFQYYHARSEAIRDAGKGTWGVAKFGRRMALRDVAWRAEGYLALYRANGHEKYRAIAMEGLQYLLAAQRKNGLFPFPALENDDPVWGQQMARVRAACPQCIEDGWVIELPADQGLQYDNGVAGVAMMEGYEALRDPRWLAAAKPAAEWAMTQPTSKNVNYNSFTTRLLARVYEHTRDQRLLDEAVRRTKEAILPTQTAGGRWSDEHNARLVYHGIITAGLVDLLRVLPAGHPFRGQLEDATQRAVKTFCELARQGDGLSPAGDAAATGIWFLTRLSPARPLSPLEQQALHLLANTYINHPDEFEKLPDHEQRHLMASRFQLGKYLAWRTRESYTTAKLEVPAVEELARYFRELHNASERFYDKQGNWNRTGGQAPDIPLRNSSRRALGYLAVLGSKLPGTPSDYRERAVAALDYLLKMQGPNGAFPYPNPGLNNPKYGRLMQAMQKADPKSVEGPWLYYIPDAVNDGGLNFDNGLAGVAMVEGCRLTGDKRYLEAARRAAHWALTQPPVPNVNYNSFSVWLLTKLFGINREDKYLAKAMELTEKAILPGQLANGEWSDAHNSILVYHAIITNGLLDLLEAAPPEHPLDARLKEQAVRAVNRMAERIDTFDVRSQGPQLNAFSLDCLLHARLMFGSRPEWERAAALLWAQRDPVVPGEELPVVLQENMPHVGRSIEMLATGRHADGKLSGARFQAPGKNTP